MQNIFIKIWMHQLTNFYHKHFFYYEENYITSNIFFLNVKLHFPVYSSWLLANYHADQNGFTKGTWVKILIGKIKSQTIFNSGEKF